MSQFDKLSLNRFLYRENSNYSALSNSPFSGLQPGISAQNSYVPTGESTQDPNRPATAIATGTLISGNTVQTSGGTNRYAGFGTGRVEMNRGFTDTIDQFFPYDSLTAFNEKGQAILIINGLVGPGGGILSLVPINRVTDAGDVLPQPKVFGSGNVFADGTPGSVFPVYPTYPAGSWTSAKLSTGRYEITHNIGNTNYGVLLTPVTATTREFSVESIDPNSFIARFYNNTTATLEDANFSFQVFTNP